MMAFSGDAFTFFKAFASPSGERVNWTAAASARNSRCRKTAPLIMRPKNAPFQPTKARRKPTARITRSTNSPDRHLSKPGSGSALDDLRVSSYNAAVNRRRLLAFLVLILCLGSIGGWRYCRWRDHRFDAVIVGAAQLYGVEPALVKAVVWRESWFNPSVRGRKNEFGLMQIRAEAAGEWDRAEKITLFEPEQLLDAATNTQAGTGYLGQILKRYQKTDNPLPYALADYNAGRSHVLRWNKGAASTNNAVFIDQMDFSSTRKYVKTVMRRYEHYRVISPP